jgi:hypothetical protein
MANRTCKPKMQPKQAQLKDLKTKKADKVKGGALNAYLRVKGQTQGDIK